MISIKLQIEIALSHGCSPLISLHKFITPFYKNTYGGLVLNKTKQCSRSAFILSLCHLKFNYLTSRFDILFVWKSWRKSSSKNHRSTLYLLKYFATLFKFRSDSRLYSRTIAFFDLYKWFSEKLNTKPTAPRCCAGYSGVVIITAA